MTKKNIPLLGEVSFAKAAFSDKYVLRDLPKWKDGKSGSKRQLLNWLHFGGVAHALKDLGGTLNYPKIGREIPAIAVIMAFLRLGNKKAAAMTLVQMGLTQAEAKTLVDQIPNPPVKLTTEEKRLKELAKSEQKLASSVISMYSDIYNKMFGNPGQTAYVDENDEIQFSASPPASAVTLDLVDKKGIAGLKARLAAGSVTKVKGGTTKAPAKKARRSFFDEDDDDDSFF